MKRIVLCLILCFCLLILPSCEQFNEALKDIFSVRNDQTFYSETLTDSVYDMCISAYNNTAIPGENTDISLVDVSKYYGRIGKAHIVSFNMRCPGKDSANRVEKLRFYYYPNYIYIIYNDALYTICEAYENEIIDFNNLCFLFGINSFGKTTFNKDNYDKIFKSLQTTYPEEPDMFEIDEYYGEYNGYSALSFNYLGGQYCVTFQESCANLYFEYGYKSSRIRFVSEENIYFIKDAMELGIISREDLMEIFKLHTKSAEFDEALLDSLLTPVYDIIQRNNPTDTEYKYEYLSLVKYYGKFGDSHIFTVHLNHQTVFDIGSWELSDDFELIKYIVLSYGDGPCVWNDGKVYPIDKAVELGLITEEVKQNIK